jgi:hypothetical protein
LGWVNHLYKFQIGQTVFLTASLRRSIPAGAYIVTKKLLEHNGEFEYRVKSANEPHERVVGESEIEQRTVAIKSCAWA